jgi:peptidoglycan hydrolase-like protein with peptidoglycan-binding domain
MSKRFKGVGSMVLVVISMTLVAQAQTSTTTDMAGTATSTTATSTIPNPTADISAPTARIASSHFRIPTTFRFSQQLVMGMVSPEVKYLQMFLNDTGFTVADDTLTPAGHKAGSRGYESKYFGPATRDALIRFQEANASAILAPAGITKGTGFFGPATIKRMNAMIQWE